MYLSDHDIRRLLPQLGIETTEPDHPFREEEQIQPCSIDLRLSNVFWIPTSRKTNIDIRRSSLAEISPRHHWKRLILKPHECQTIKPGQIIFGRTYERFSLPEMCAGKLEGRSSFARMGLAVHATGDFINPGWRGHMPLQLVNNGPHAIKVFPFIPICQLLLVPLTSVPSRIYNDPSLQSKYMEDDGGPSYWWRDQRIKKLQVNLGKHDIGTAVQIEILDTVGVQEPEILERFESYVDKLPHGILDSSVAILENFAEAEDRKRKTDKVLRWLQGVPMTVLVAISVRMLFEDVYLLIHYATWFLTILSGLLAARIITVPENEYLGKRELMQIIRKKGTPAALPAKAE